MKNKRAVAHHHKKSKALGLTLLELMVSMAIIGILASLALANYQSYINRALISSAVEYTMPFMVQAADAVLTGEPVEIAPMSNLPLEPVQCITVTTRNKPSCDIIEIEVWAGKNFDPAVKAGTTRLFIQQGKMNASRSGVTWKCGPFRNKNKNIDVKLLPTSCRDAIPNPGRLCSLSAKQKKARNRCKKGMS